MQKILDVDYQDLCLSGNGDPEALKRLFDRSKQAGFSKILFAPMNCGKALYPSKVAALGNKPSRTYPRSGQIIEMMGKFDVMAEVTKLAGEFDLKLMVYFRLVDDHFPELEEEYLSRHPQWWWQSRCGTYVLPGWPCYHYPQVREYKLRLLNEQLAYGVDEVLFDLARSHSFYVSPHRQTDFFGFNEPIARAFAERTGVDIRAYDHINFLTHNQGVYERIPYIYSVEYVNPAEFDRTLWHWIKGEGFEMFLREARGLMGKKPAMALGAFAPPHPVAMEQIVPANFFLDSNKLVREGVLDGVLHGANWSDQKLTADMNSYMFPYCDGVRQAGKPVGAWLNDIILAKGGGTSPFASADEVRDYWKKYVQPSSMDFVVIHEADFILCHPQRDSIWQTLAACA